MGPDRPTRRAAGHDVNYIVVSGTLAMIGPSRGAAQRPRSTSSGDFGGGGMLLAFGVVCGLL